MRAGGSYDVDVISASRPVRPVAASEPVVAHEPQGRLEVRSGHDWYGLVDVALPAAGVEQWLVDPSCGAVVTFVGRSRDHSEGRPDVTLLEFEAYEAPAVERLGLLAGELRSRFSGVVKLAMLHRVGPVPLGDAAVVVGVSAPHRDLAFDACRFGIDALKATVPIWKHETWQGGRHTGRDAQHLVDAASFEPVRRSVDPSVASGVGGTR